MSQKLNNGALLALLAAGALTVAGSAANRRRGQPMLTGSRAHHQHGSGSCSRCGVTLSGARNVEEPFKYFEGESAPPKWATTTLFWARATDRAGWFTDYSFTERVVSQYGRVRREAAKKFNELLDQSGTELVAGLREYAKATSAEADAAMKGVTFGKFNRKAAKAKWKKEYQARMIAAGNAAFHESDLGRASQAQEQILERTYGAYSREREDHSLRQIMSLLFYAEYKANASTAPRRWGGSSVSADLRQKARELDGLNFTGNLSALQPNTKNLANNYLAVVIEYLRLLWVKRAWALHVLGEMKKEGVAGVTRRDRRAVTGTDQLALWSDVDWKLAIAGSAGDALGTLQNTNALPVGEIKAATTQQADLDTSSEESPDKDDEETPLPLQVGSPTLRFYRDGRRQTMWWITKNGTMQFEKGRSDVPLLTETSKMASPSFSLPAFTSLTGGTCPMAEVSDSRMEALAGLRGRKTVICSACYALTSGYAYANVMTDAAGRKDWVDKGLKKDRTGAFMGGLFATMIASYAIWGRGGKRSKQEIGVWDGEQITKWGARKRTVVKNTALKIASYDTQEVRPNTLALFEGTPKGKLAGFFRLHDSGDLFSPKYIQAWTVAARTMPKVYIWIPTRTWIGKAKAEINSLEGGAKAWYRAWTDGTLKGSKLWRLRLGSAARRRGGRNLLDETPNTVKEQSPGEAGLGDWYLDENCGTTVLPVGDRGFGPSLRDLAALPNVTLRPSGLYIKEYPDDPVTIPVVSGLSAGSGVVRKYNPLAYKRLLTFRQAVRHRSQLQAETQKRQALARAQEAKEREAFQRQDKTRILRQRSVTKTRTAAQVADDSSRILKYTQISSMQLPGVPAQEAYQCPVYTEDAQGKEMKSCQEAKCRACWILPDLPIFYGAH